MDAIMTEGDMDALIPLEIRLGVLESQIRGSDESGNDVKVRNGKEGSSGLLQRVQSVHEALERVSKDSEGLKRLFQGCEWSLTSWL